MICSYPVKKLDNEKIVAHCVAIWTESGIKVPSKGSTGPSHNSNESPKIDHRIALKTTVLDG